MNNVIRQLVKELADMSKRVKTTEHLKECRRLRQEVYEMAQEQMKYEMEQQQMK